MAYYPPTDWELKDFFREHVDALYRCCNFLTCGQGDAQKMTQDIFLTLLKKGMVFSSDKDGRAWMILMAYKMSKKPPMPLAKEAEQPEAPRIEEAALHGDAVSASDCATEECAVTEDALRTEDDASSGAEEAATAESVQSLDGDMQSSDESDESAETQNINASDAVSAFPHELCKLSRRDRLIALLYYCEGYRKSEIANYLGWPTFRVSKRLARIRKHILPEKGTVEVC